MTQPREFALSARIALWIVLVSVLARVTSLPRTHRIVSTRVRSTSVHAFETAAHLARRVTSLLLLDVFVFKPSCWKRALVLHRYLALHGIESRVNFGLQKDTEGNLRGHAWLEHDGRPFLESDAGNFDATEYIVTFSLPRTASPSQPGVEGSWP